MLYNIFQHDLELVLIQRILIGFEAILENIFPMHLPPFPIMGLVCIIDVQE